MTPGSKGAGGAPPQESRTWRLRLRDRPGAVERVLAVLRKRLVPLEGMALERAAEGELAVELRVRAEAERWARVEAELEGLPDVQRAEGPRFPADHANER